MTVTKTEKKEVKNVSTDIPNEPIEAKDDKATIAMVNPEELEATPGVVPS